MGDRRGVHGDRTSDHREILGYPVALSQVRRVGEALGQELERQQMARVKQSVQERARRGDAIASAPKRNESMWLPMGGCIVRPNVMRKGSWSGRKRKPSPSTKRKPGEESAEPTGRRSGHPSTDCAGLPPPVRPQDQPQLSYVVRAQGTWQQAGAWFWAEARDRGVGSAITDLAVIADGGEGLSQMVESHLRQRGITLTRILDIRHAQQHLWDIARLLAADQRAWLAPAVVALEQGAVAELLAILMEVAITFPQAAQAATTASAYFEARFRQIDYPTFVQHGYQIGSGLAESACKRFGTDRMKGTGMRWTPSVRKRLLLYVPCV